MATTTNMGLILPDVGVTVGPTYATQNNTAFTTVDSHDHTSGKGVQVPSAGININDTLEFNDNAATEFLYTGFTSQGSISSVNNIVQVVSNELHFRDGSGNDVQITSNGALDITSSGGIGGDYTSAGASVTFSNTDNSYTFVNGSAVQSILKFKGLENTGKCEYNTTDITTSTTITDTDDNHILLVDTSAARTITLPDPTLGNRCIVIKDQTGSSETNNITLARNGSENIEGVAASYTLALDRGSWTVISDGTDWWIVGDRKEQAVKTLASQYVVDDTQTIPDNSPGWGTLAISSTDFEATSTPITRSSNTFSCSSPGFYYITLLVGDVALSGASEEDLNVRIRNTTDSTTLKQFEYRLDGDSDAVSLFCGFEIASGDVGDTLEIQWQIDSASDTADINSTNGNFLFFEFLGLNL